jgi:hypothetical protein
MSTIQDWSTTAASNTSIDGIDVGENCSPAGLNNAIRAAMANIAQFLDVVGGKAVSGGAADVQTLTTGLSLSAYQQGLLMGFEAGFTNTGATTMNVDGLGAKSVKTPAGAALTAGMITAGGIYLMAYEATADVIILLNATASAASVTRATLGLATSDSPEFAGLNVGHPTDTTITRLSAGVPGVEGTALLRASQNLADVSTPATARSNISAAAKSQTASGFYGLVLGSLSNRDYRVVINARRAFTITGVTTRSVSGTATATFKINTTALGGTANAVSSSEVTQAHASANSVVAGDDIVITISANSSCVDLSFSIQITDTLA